MRKRNFKEKFTTVFQVRDEKQQLVVMGLEGDRRLAKNLQQVIASYEQPQEESLARLFVKSSLNGNEVPFDKDHLCAYLDEACLWIGKDLAKELSPLDLRPSECFSSAREFAANPQKTFKNYDLTKSSVQKYAFFQIKTAAKEHLYLGEEVCKYSPWGLLRYSSKRKFSEALQQKTNFSKKEIESCLLARECYQKIYTSSKEKGSKQLAEPSLEQWQDIVNYYNQLCSKKNLEPVADYRQIKEWLELCIQARIDYSKASFAPLEEEGFIGDCDEEFYFKPQAEELMVVNSVLEAAFLNLEPEERRLLKLWYGLGISQSDIAEVLEIEKQYQVSRSIKKYNKKLLLALAKWCGEVQKMDLSEEAIEGLSEPIAEWLKQYCQKEFQEFLRKVVTSDRPYDLQLLRLRYGENLKPNAVAKKLDISLEAAADRLEKVREYLVGELQQFVVDNLGVKLPSSATQKVASFVENWLVEAPYGAWY